MAVNLSDLSAASVTTESDVEQKIILPLLTAGEWLAVPESAVRTKHYLPPTTIDKGAGRRVGYFPDYSVWIDGLPILVIEAKSPLESAVEGFREAQLYAHEVNKAYPTGVNPLSLVLATNGKTLLFGSWDSQPSTSYEASDLLLGNKLHSLLREMLGIAALKQTASAIRAKFRPTPLFRPIDFIGGDAALNRRIGFNSFATDLATLIRMYFVSDTAERLDDIIARAYVSSDEITKYDNILETFLRERVEQIVMPGSRAIQTSKHGETALTPELRHFTATLPSSGHIQLLIGPVGSGKSLFCQRYYRFLQPEDIKKNVHWAFLDFNTAPDDLSSIEEWMCQSFVESLASCNPDFDIYEAKNLRRIFAPDIEKFRKVYAAVSTPDKEAFEARLADKLAAWVSDPKKLATAISRFLLGDRRKGLIVVFDNVDRRDREQQLRIFQAAQWFRSETRAFCLLSLRDETYEQYKRGPPLDAFINAIHFTISPPRFIDVVRKRMELAIEHLSENAPEKLSYELPNGKKISYPATRLGQYLKTLYIDIFRGNRKIGWVLEALSGRDVRRSLEMFTRILMSGDLDERRVTGTMLGTVEFVIPESLIIRILMKTDYVFFSENHGFVSNIFLPILDGRGRATFWLWRL